MAFEVRVARPEEYEEAGEATAAAYREFARPDPDWEEYLDRIADIGDRADRTLVLVAIEHERILGSLTLELSGRVERHDDRDLDPDEAHVRMLGVRPDARRRGVARALMGIAELEARRAGKRRMTLHTTQRMIAAQAMYDGLGFTRTQDRVFPDGFVLLGYQKDLAPPGSRPEG